MTLFLGIDTGGTYTDAVLFDPERGPIRAAKALTTRHDLALGVDQALARVLGDDAGAIALVALSTTLATNAIVEGHGARVGLVLIGQGPEVLARAGLGRLLGGDPVVYLSGGHDATGAEREALDLDAAATAIAHLVPEVAAFAVAGYFATRNPAHEEAIAALIRERTGAPVSLSHALSARLDAPRRALTAVLNARLVPLLDRLVRAVGGLLAARGIAAPLMVVKGDGSLIGADFALGRPVETILSGPAASVIGARYLAGVADSEDAVVVDMGGTTTDIAVLAEGRPLLDAEGARVGGFRTMVEAVAVHTLGLGGDSEVHRDEWGALALGPNRVVPLALLGHLHPETIAVLRRQAGRDHPLSHDGRFALASRPLGDGEAGLTGADRRLHAALGAGPVALEALFAAHHRERSLGRLVARGLAAIAAFTPSDAAHVLGRHDAWSVEAARLGARLWVRAIGGDVAGFCRAVVARLATLSAEALVTAALAEGEGRTPDGSPFARFLLDRGLGGESAGMIDVAFTLKRPLVAIGAPAATYYPAVAERLDTRLCVPPFAAVSNAVGAVAGGVVQRVAALVTAPSDGLFRVHVDAGVADFTALEAACRHAAETVSALALARAEAAGAAATDVEVERDDTIVEGPGGLRIFLESRLVATASGRPRIARDAARRP